MSAKAPSPKGRKPRENNYIFELGVRGRKTGLTVPDSGVRDEHGMEPMDDLFSSPEKAKSNRSVRNSEAASLNATLSSEEDMDMGQSTIPEPTSILNARKGTNIRIPPPKSKSPIKTFLQSPPKRNPSLGPSSSPTRGSVVVPKRASVPTSVARRLNFSIDNHDRNPEKTSTTGSPRKGSGSQKPNTQSLGAKLSNGTRFSPMTKTVPSPDRTKQRSTVEQINDEDDDKSEEEDAFYPIMDEDERGATEEPLYEEDLVRDSTPEPDPDSPIQAIRQKAKAAAPKRDKPKAASKTAPKAAPKNVPKISPKIAAPKTAVAKSAAPKAKAIEIAIKPQKRKAPGQPVEQPPAKKSKDARNEIQDAAVEDNERPAKRGRGRPKKVESSRFEKVEKVNKAKKLESKPAPKSSSPARISSPAEVHRGPPRPRNNRGLYILRREMPHEVVHTKSGRSVVKPVAYWKNEAVVYGNDEEGNGDASFLHPTIKEVIRLDHIETPSRPRPRRRGPNGGRKPVTARENTPSESEHALAEPWEKSPGRVYGAVRMWNPLDPIGEDSAEREDEIALSAAAIITRDIGATFQFAKTLTLPFFGSGMVDLPPGAFKKPKNTRRMQMVFFVFTGRVSVTVNENSFSIGRGGMWQVPRGNFYSIENDYDKPARIFFSQGCEVLEESLEEDDGPEGPEGPEAGGSAEPSGQETGEGVDGGDRVEGAEGREGRETS